MSLIFASVCCSSASFASAGMMTTLPHRTPNRIVLCFFHFPCGAFQKREERRGTRSSLRDCRWPFHILFGYNRSESKGAGSCPSNRTRKYDIPDAVCFAEGIGQQLFDCCTFGQDDFFFSIRPWDFSWSISISR